MAILLVPLDTSGIAQKVLRQAELLAKEMHAKICLLHVIEPIVSYVPVGMSMDVMASSPPELETEQTDVAKGRLECLAAPLRAKGLDVDCEACFGLAVEEITDQAKTQGADYIVLGSHGHGALHHLFGGSVVTGVLKHSPCPVVVVPVREERVS